MKEREREREYKGKRERERETEGAREISTVALEKEIGAAGLLLVRCLLLLSGFRACELTEI